MDKGEPSLFLKLEETSTVLLACGWETVQVQETWPRVRSERALADSVAVRGCYAVNILRPATLAGFSLEREQGRPSGRVSMGKIPWRRETDNMVGRNRTVRTAAISDRDQALARVKAGCWATVT